MMLPVVVVIVVLVVVVVVVVVTTITRWMLRNGAKHAKRFHLIKCDKLTQPNIQASQQTQFLSILNRENFRIPFKIYLSCRWFSFPFCLYLYLNLSLFFTFLRCLNFFFKRDDAWAMIRQRWTQKNITWSHIAHTQPHSLHIHTQNLALFPTLSWWVNNRMRSNYKPTSERKKNEEETEKKTIRIEHKTNK